MRISGDLQRNLAGPLRPEIDLPFQRAYYPHGFRLDLASNSREVLDAAEENWGMYEPEYDDPPLTLRVLVQPGGEPSPPPVHNFDETPIVTTAPYEYSLRETASAV